MAMKIIQLNKVESTNNEAKAYIKASPLDPHLKKGIVFIANEQTKGRGTHQKKWESKPGGLYYTLLIHLPRFHLEGLATLVKGVGQVVVTILNTQLNINCYLEWPNDIILGHKKMGGILIESISVSHSKVPKALMIGIGINLNQEKFESDLAAIATSVRQITGQIVEKSDLITQLNKELSKWLYAEYGAQPALTPILEKKF